MKILENILLATDLFPSSKNVVGNAIALAKAFHSRVTVFHVLPENIGNDKAKKLLEETVKGHLTDINARINKEGVKTTEPLVEWGDHCEKIVAAGKRLNVNLIVIGSGETEKGQKFSLGTTAEKVIKLSAQPVFVVKPEEALTVKTILCPVDFSEQSRRALKDAIIFARRFEAELIILSVYKPITSSTFSFKYDWEEENSRIAFNHIAQFNEFLKGFNLRDVNWKKEVRRGKPETEILAEISESNIGLLIMGTTGRSGLSKMMIGSVTEKVIREVPCTFITTKTQDVIQLQLENRIKDIESHYHIAVQLMKDGFYAESIAEFETCLKINDMHVPAIHGIVKVYDKLENQEMADKYRKLAREVLRRIWDSKIEDEIRKYYSY
ncbi:MAG: universal stress protein [Lewinellaceae bacterium]|nr:universal stress protein [Phaeodactylibacter sp.]MCB9351483.1 universal stress protein [Lewinellaceae bacterium]